MIDASFAQKIADLATTAVVTLDEVQYATRPVFNAPLPDEPQVETLTVATLDGLVEYVKTQVDFEDEGGIPLIHVFSPWRVYLISPIENLHRRRDTFVKVAYDEDGIFPFDEFMGHADFMIKLQTRFAPTSDMAHVQKAVGTVKADSLKTSIDDGISQRGVVSNGVALLSEAEVPRQVMLQPLRTFSEVIQPESLFVLRLSQGRPGEMPQAALFEADGGAWKLEAVGNIRDYLKKALPDMAVIA